MNEANFLLATAQTYATNASNIFNFFLTVVFGSFAFAAALPLRHIGRLFRVGCFEFSSSSLVIGCVFALFYGISFTVFHNTFRDLSVVLDKLNTLLMQVPTLADVAYLYQLPDGVVFGLELSSLGFLIGSLGGLVIFMWVTNVKR